MLYAQKNNKTKQSNRYSDRLAGFFNRISRCLFELTTIFSLHLWTNSQTDRNRGFSEYEPVKYIKKSKYFRSVEKYYKVTFADDQRYGRVVQIWSHTQRGRGVWWISYLTLFTPVNRIKIKITKKETRFSANFGGF